jgi:hypothetical protein
MRRKPKKPYKHVVSPYIPPPPFLRPYGIKAVAHADGSECPYAGQWLKSMDFDACGGQGHAEFTPDRSKALRFTDAGAALMFWRTKSTVKPMRADGKPNRPLTALTAVMEELQ